MKSRAMTIICVVLTLAVIGTLIALLARSSDNFCGTCQGLDSKVCPNKQLLRKLYEEGKLTEFTDLKKGDKWGSFGAWDQFHTYPDSPVPNCQ